MKARKVRCVVSADILHDFPAVDVFVSEVQHAGRCRLHVKEVCHLADRGYVGVVALAQAQEYSTSTRSRAAGDSGPMDSTTRYSSI